MAAVKRIGPAFMFCPAGLQGLAVVERIHRFHLSETFKFTHSFTPLVERRIHQLEAGLRPATDSD